MKVGTWAHSPFIPTHPEFRKNIIIRAVPIQVCTDPIRSDPLHWFATIRSDPIQPIQSLHFIVQQLQIGIFLVPQSMLPRAESIGIGQYSLQGYLQPSAESWRALISCHCSRKQPPLEFISACYRSPKLLQWIGTHSSNSADPTPPPIHQKACRSTSTPIRIGGSGQL